MASTQRPLVVDLDGTLTKTDTLFELAVHFVSQRVRNVFGLIGLLGKDRATLKAELARRAPIEVSHLPINTEVAAALDRARADKRPVVLATASDQLMADTVARVWGPFDRVVASSPGNNLKSHRKAQALVDLFGEKGFDYIGNDRADIAVIARAHEGFLVSPGRSLLVQARATGTPVGVVGGVAPVGRALVRAVRPHQWAKNGLLVIPALAAWLPFLDASLALLVGIAAFSLMASSVYLLNDVWDVQHDRTHPTKKARALASGDLPLGLALLLAPVLGLGALVLSWLYFGAAFTGVLGIYAAVTVAYSTRLKRVALVDVFALAGLYGVRIVAGAVAVGVPLSPWLISFSLFVFLSLALIKRVTELGEGGEDPEALVRGRGYVLSDAPMLSLFGVSSGFMAGVILSLYIEDPAIQSMYATPALLWAVVPVWLYWISRAWLRTHRGAMKDDPVLFALTDRPTYVAGALIVITVFFAR